MKLVEVEDVPKRKAKNCNLRMLLNEFMSSSSEIVKVEGLEHKNVNIARSCFWRSITTGGYPISVKVRGNDLYLIRRDM